MKQKLSVSTGSFWKPGKWLGHNQAIRKISKLNVKNIELCLLDFEEIFNLNVLQAKKDLKKFKTIGIHLPGHYYRKDKETKFVVDVMHFIYKTLKADYVVVHMDWLKNPHHLKKKKWNILVENVTGRHKVGYQKFSNFIKKHKLNMLLDVNHASDYGEKEIQNYIKKLKNKIKAVHLAGGHDKKKFHKDFSKASKKFLKSLEPIKELNCPIVLEMSRITFKQLKKEIKEVKEWFAS